MNNENAKTGISQHSMIYLGTPDGREVEDKNSF